jgi:hypothetical protein
MEKTNKMKEVASNNPDSTPNQPIMRNFAITSLPYQATKTLKIIKARNKDRQKRTPHASAWTSRIRIPDMLQHRVAKETRETPRNLFTP